MILLYLNIVEFPFRYAAIPLWVPPILLVPFHLIGRRKGQVWAFQILFLPFVPVVLTIQLYTLYIDGIPLPPLLVFLPGMVLIVIACVVSALIYLKDLMTPDEEGGLSGIFFCISIGMCPFLIVFLLLLLHYLNVLQCEFILMYIPLVASLLLTIIICICSNSSCEKPALERKSLLGS
jgi:hypothetical protein